MGPVRRAWNEFREAARAFSRPARFYLGAEFLMWTAHGIFSVLFNLYLVESGASEGFVGRAVSSTGIGMVIAALPAGWLADRWGRRRTLMLGAVLRARATCCARCPHAPIVLWRGTRRRARAVPVPDRRGPAFITDQSTPKERTHLLSTFFT